MLTEKNFDTGTVMIHFVEGPPAGRPLVLLHGATVRWQTFLGVLPLLSSRYHVYALDLRGHGLSGRTPGAYQIEHFADDVEQFLHTEVGEPAALLGWSLGADVALQVAADLSELTPALILEDPRMHTVGTPDAEMEYWRAPRDLLRTGPTWEELMAVVAQRNPDPDSTFHRAKAKAYSQLDPGTLTSLMENTMDENYHPDELLMKITCPVLLLQADPAMGAVVQDEDVEWYRSRLADCTHVCIPGTGHNMHRRQPMVFCEMVTNFLESL